MKPNSQTACALADARYQPVLHDLQAVCRWGTGVCGVREAIVVDTRCPYSQAWLTRSWKVVVEHALQAVSVCEVESWKVPGPQLEHTRCEVMVGAVAE